MDWQSLVDEILEVDGYDLKRIAKEARLIPRTVYNVHKGAVCAPSQPTRDSLLQLYAKVCYDKKGNRKPLKTSSSVEPTDRTPEATDHAQAD